MSDYPLLIPTILTNTFDEFSRQVDLVKSLVPYVQIDVMDGEFVLNRSFPDIEKINELETDLPWELHLMVNHPLLEMQKWMTIKNVQRAIFPIESLDNPTECIAYARGQCWQVGMVLNPETPLSAIESYLSKLDVVLFMTVVPGKQGNPFVTEVGEKIKAFTALKKRPLCAVDGAVSTTTIPLLNSWGVEIFNVGSALMKTEDVKKAYEELSRLLRID